MNFPGGNIFFAALLTFLSSKDRQRGFAVVLPAKKLIPDSHLDLIGQRLRGQ